ncbi:MAG: DNA primase [Phycisphaeraceae bacterium]|nr:DNA primase [Phycisphaeraceae bacterium]MCB9847259.1 DNA primase [Phycisphaeraceae bacterium]
MTTERSTAWNDDRRRVLDATDIVALIGEHLALHAKGREYVAVCPFHDDHKPSMTVVPHKQIFHCFACGAGGNAYDFMMRFHGMDFRETLQRLADRAGITLTPYKPSAANAERAAGDAHATRDDIARANAFAQGFFRSILNHAEHGAAARRAIAGRGFDDETIEGFQLGAAPDRWDGLLLTIRSNNLNPDHFLAAGLLKRRDEGGLYDALRNRVIFPILDQIGRPIAFGARRINEDDEPKYLNSPETALFDKSSTLFALDKAARPIQSERRAIIVEGYTDAIACHQAGVRHVVATLGTALTGKHALALGRLCDRVVLLFDADAAGLKAADRGVEVFFSSNVDVSIAVLPDGADPADLLGQPGGRRRFDEIIDTAEDALAFRFRRLRERLEGAGVSARAGAVERDIERLVELGLAAVAPIRRRLIVRGYANLVGVDERLVIDTVAAASARRQRREFVRENDQDAAHNATQEANAIRLTSYEHALGCLLADPTLIHCVASEDHHLLTPDAAPTAATRAIAQCIERRADADSAGVLGAALDLIEDPLARALAARAARAADEFCEHNRDELRAHLLDCLLQWRRRENRTALGSTSGAGSPSMTGPGSDARTPQGAPAGPTPIATEQTAATATDDNQRLADLIEARRQRHQSTGGDPLALPRPVSP